MTCSAGAVRCVAAMMMIAQATLAAQTSPAPTVTPTVTRADLSFAYLRIDKAYASAQLTDTVRAAVNRIFDRSTLSFFTGRLSATLATIDSAMPLITSSPVALTPVASRIVNGKAASTYREAYSARLQKVDSAGPLAQAVASARARANLLVDEPSRERTAEFFSNPAQLVRDLAREVSVLERGRNPYIGQAGDQWRVFRGANGAMIPMRIVAPSAAATSTRPIPVLIALHGAGGDENMFVDAYGQGIIATLSLAESVILVSPATTQFSASPANFDSLMIVLRSEYRIDSTRIYLLGHSMGAGAVARLAQQRPAVIAGVACLAGGSAVTVANAPPILFIGADLDPIIPARNVQAAASATPSGKYEVLLHEGHTLMVANGVRRALPWLFEHRRP